MPLVLWVSKPLALENVSQVSSTVIAHNLRAHHTEARVRSLADGAGNGIPERRPPAARVELVVGLVQRRLAALAGVDARGRVVLVECAGARGLGALLAQDAELLCAALDVASMGIQS